jgi:hypothetical protein
MPQERRSKAGALEREKKSPALIRQIRVISMLFSFFSLIIDN